MVLWSDSRYSVKNPATEGQNPATLGQNPATLGPNPDVVQKLLFQQVFLLFAEFLSLLSVLGMNLDFLSVCEV